MKTMYTTILFDLDGTITDPGEGITKSVEYALSKWNIKVDDRRSLYKFVGPPLIDSFTEYYGMSLEDARTSVKYYREHYSEKGLFDCTIYDGIEELLSNLKKIGCTVVLATSKPEKFAIDILEHFGLLKYFDFVGGATMDERRTKKTEVIEYVLDNIEEKNRDKIIMIGDRHYDVLGAKEYSIDSIGVLYGYGGKEELIEAGANYIVEKADEIEGIIKMVDGIIFDVDGTLWDSTPIVEKAWNQALIDKGFPEISVTADRLKGLFGLPMDDIIEDIMPEVSLEKRNEFKPFCFSYEHEFLEREPGILYPKLEETLSELASRHKLFVVSNCQAGYIELFYRKTGFEKYFTDHLCPGDTNMLKADNIKKIVNDYNLKNPMYVGDTHMDEEACRKAGVPFTFASYGFGHGINPDFEIKEFSDLTRLF